MSSQFAPSQRPFDERLADLSDYLTVLTLPEGALEDRATAWRACYALSPEELVGELLRDVTSGARVVVLLHAAGNAVTQLRRADGRLMLDADQTAEGRHVFVRALGREGQLDRDVLSRLLLRNLIRVLRSQGARTIELYPREGTAPLWLAAGWGVTDGARAVLREALMARAETLASLLRDRSELAAIAQWRDQPDHNPAGLAELAGTTTPVLGKPLGRLMFAPDLKPFLQGLRVQEGPLTEPLPRTVFVFDLTDPERLERLRRFLTGSEG